ncbi:phosphoadenosine phosphosulfate reductase family protein [Candidatus Pacearchaeota archaeon]|nr:phosphoadenosine phosphosulfate reductase family protein [Candidatus Pacearchaeota archaeon]
MRTRQDLTEKQNKNMLWKIQASLNSICEFYEKNNGMVYVAFSGGRDSTVLADLVRYLYPEVPLVFCDTGMEYPEIREFVKTFSNVVFLKPKKSFRRTLEENGYPIISKKVSMSISRYRGTLDPEVQRPLRLFGGINPTSGKYQYPTIPKKYHHIVNAPFKISDYCCQVMKKAPLQKIPEKNRQSSVYRDNGK